MPQRKPKSKDGRAKLYFQSWMSLIILATLLTNCINFGEIKNGIVFIASRGSNPVAQSISWSPLDENKVLIRAYETPLQPAELYLLDIQTHEKEYIVGPTKNAQFIETKWVPDGRRILILAIDTTGFEPSGWWAVNINGKSAEFIVNPMDTIAWSPDRKFIAALDRNNSTGIEFKLIDIDTKVEQNVTEFADMDYTSGMSWSPDGQFVAFALGKYQGSNSLFVLNVKTMKVSTISEGNKSEQPSWSPKGNIIVFEDKGRLRLISSDGKCVVEIPGLDDVWSPTWSPDGRKIGYIGRKGIYYLDPEQVLGRDIYEDLCE